MAELTLNDVLDRNTILTNVDASDKEEVFDVLSQRLYEQKYIDSVEAFKKAVHDREKEGVTGIGEHIAIPHGRSETVRRNGVAIAVLNHEMTTPARKSSCFSPSVQAERAPTSICACFPCSPGRWPKAKS